MCSSDLLSMIRTVAIESDPRRAALQVRAGAGHSLRRQAVTTEVLDETWSLVAVDFTDTEAFSAEICSFGPDVVVMGPAELRESVIRRLAGALGSAPGSDEQGGSAGQLSDGVTR